VRLWEQDAATTVIARTQRMWRMMSSGTGKSE
jgi:hypothetical protein